MSVSSRWTNITLMLSARVTAEAAEQMKSREHRHQNPVRLGLEPGPIWVNSRRSELHQLPAELWLGSLGTLTLSLAFSHTHTHTLSLSNPLSYPLTLTSLLLSLSLTLSVTHSHSLPPSLPPSLTHSLTHSHSTTEMSKSFRTKPATRADCGCIALALEQVRIDRRRLWLAQSGKHQSRIPSMEHDAEPTTSSCEAGCRDVGCLVRPSRHQAPLSILPVVPALR